MWADAVSDIIIRRAVREDIPSVSRMLKVSWHDAHDDIMGKEAAARIGEHVYAELNLTFAISQGHFFIAEHEDRIVGMATSQSEGRAHVSIGLLYVDPGYQGIGVGKSLVAAILHCYPSAEAIVLEVLVESERARRFYELLGFVSDGDVRESILGDGMMVQPMRKDVLPKASHKRTFWQWLTGPRFRFADDFKIVLPYSPRDAVSSPERRPSE